MVFATVYTGPTHAFYGYIGSLCDVAIALDLVTVTMTPSLLYPFKTSLELDLNGWNLALLPSYLHHPYFSLSSRYIHTREESIAVSLVPRSCQKVAHGISAILCMLRGV